MTAHNPEHTALCLRAAHWIRTTGKMPVAFAEPGSGGRERPDAIGWNREGWSILVECKVTVADFKKDVAKRKLWANERYPGMGQERYYLTPMGLLTAFGGVCETMPGDWGLLELRPNGTIRRRMPPTFPSVHTIDDEIRMAEWAVLYPQMYRAAEGALV